MKEDESALRRAVLTVALLNFAYFGIEFAVATKIGSVSLFADSIDFLEDTTINLLIFFALSWSIKRRALVGIFLSGIILIPGISTLWAAWQKILMPVPPDPILLSAAGFFALVINIVCALILARFRNETTSLTRAAFLSARNDVFADIAIIGAAVMTSATLSPWPDLIVGLGIFVINFDAAKEVYSKARSEQKGYSKHS